MKVVKVAKARLLEQLTQNLEQHQREYAEALRGYQDRLVHVLTRRLERAKKRLTISHTIELEVPEDHSGDYQRTLAMLEWVTDEHLELDRQEFRCYALDEWKWKNHFREVHADYIAPPVKDEE
jgi:hypothetical protein